MTLEQATAKCHEWLGTWRPGRKCRKTWHSCPHREFLKGNDFIAHDIPMPPADDAMLAQILRRLGEERTHIEFFFKDTHSQFGWQWDCEIDYRLGGFMTDPVNAAIVACAEWLVARKEQGE